MTAPPPFASLRDHISRLGDVDFWGPYVADILRRHGLGETGREPQAGFNPTYPTFLCGDVVVKLFGCSHRWRETFAAERAALALAATDPTIAAPRLLAEGRLSEAGAAPWPYLVTTRMAGVAWRAAELSPDQRLAVAVELGRQVRRVHALRPAGEVARVDWRALDVTAAARRSSLPSHLIE